MAGLTFRSAVEAAISAKLIGAGRPKVVKGGCDFTVVRCGCGGKALNFWLMGRRFSSLIHWPMHGESGSAMHIPFSSHRLGGQKCPPSLLAQRFWLELLGKSRLISTNHLLPGFHLFARVRCKAGK